MAAASALRKFREDDKYPKKKPPKVVEKFNQLRCAPRQSRRTNKDRSPQGRTQREERRKKTNAAVHKSQDSDAGSRRLVLEVLRSPRSQRARDREPAWRWYRAMEIAQLVKSLSSTAAGIDPAVTAAFWHIRKSVDDQAQQQVERIQRVHHPKDPDFSAAYDIWANPLFEPTRNITEALLMANSTPERIAEDCGLSAGVARLYEAVFFDVRAFLPRKFQINSILLPSISSVSGNPSKGEVLKAVGYYLGADAVLRYADLNADLTAEDKDFIAVIIEHRLRKMMLSRILATVVTNDNAASLVRQFMVQSAAQNTPK